MRKAFIRATTAWNISIHTTRDSFMASPKDKFLHFFRILFRRTKNFFTNNWKEILISTGTGASIGLAAGLTVGGLIAGGFAIPTFGLGFAIYPVVTIVFTAGAAMAGFFAGLIGVLICKKKPRVHLSIVQTTPNNNTQAEVVSENNANKNTPGLTATSQILETLNPAALVQPTPVTPPKKSEPAFDLNKILDAADTANWKYLENLDYTQNEKIKIAHILFSMNKFEAAVVLIDSLKLERDQLLRNVFDNLLNPSVDIKNLNAYLREKWKICSVAAISCYTMLLNKMGARTPKLFKILQGEYHGEKIEEHYKAADLKSQVEPFASRFKSSDRMQEILKELDNKLQALIEVQKMYKENKSVLSNFNIQIIKEAEAAESRLRKREAANHNFLADCLSNNRETYLGM
jgi:hypothetical protein